MERIVVTNGKKFNTLTPEAWENNQGYYKGINWRLATPEEIAQRYPQFAPEEQPEPQAEKDSETDQEEKAETKSGKKSRGNQNEDKTGAKD